MRSYMSIRTIFLAVVFINSVYSNYCTHQKGCRLDVSTAQIPQNDPIFDKLKRDFNKTLQQEMVSKLKKKANQGREGKKVGQALRDQLRLKNIVYEEIIDYGKESWQYSGYFIMQGHLITLRQVGYQPGDSTNVVVIIYKIAPPNLQKIQVIRQSYIRKIHGYDGYFAVISDDQSQSNFTINVYKLESSGSILIRSYKNKGIYQGSVQYNSDIMVVMFPLLSEAQLYYPWNVSGVGMINSTYFYGPYRNFQQSLTRSFARIPLGPQSNKNYRFSMHLFAQSKYSNYQVTLTPNLNIFIIHNDYKNLSPNDSTVIVMMPFYEDPNTSWGKGRWAIVPGLILYYPYFNFQLDRFKSKDMLQEFNGYLRFASFENYTTNRLKASYVRIVKIPVNTFDPSQGSTQYNLGENGLQFYQITWKNDLAFIMFRNGLIKTYSSQFGKITGRVKEDFFSQSYDLRKYGQNYMISVGRHSSNTSINIYLYEVLDKKLKLLKSLKLMTDLYYGNSIVNWELKRLIIFMPPLNETEKGGTIQIYVNPLEDCMYTIPIDNRLCKNRNNQIQISNKYSQNRIYLYSSVSPFGKIVRFQNKFALLSIFHCQFQLRILLDKDKNWSYLPSEFSYLSRDCYEW